MLRFDAKGRPLSPETTDHLLEAAAGATDVVVFCHGWNTSWYRATRLYRAFLEQLQSTLDAWPVDAAPRAEQGSKPRHRSTGSEGWATPFLPIFVGLAWPSLSWLRSSERGPTIGGSPEPASSADVELSGGIDLSSGLELSPGSEMRAGNPRSGAAESSDSADLADDGSVELEADWPAEAGAGQKTTGSGRESTDPAGNLPGFAGEAAIPENELELEYGDRAGTGPGAAGALGDWDPRSVVRVSSVWTMKDRAGLVGLAGVGPLLGRLLGAGACRIHLVGHSFGARVMLSALASAPAHATRRVHSLLLLQPAVNAWCFAEQVQGRDGIGGFRSVLERVELPPIATYSRHDGPLRRVFPLALRRRKDLGEASLAATPELPVEEPARQVSRWSALGGVGPLGLDEEEMARLPMPAPGEPYPLGSPSAGRILAVDGTARIADHGDVANSATAWALRCCLAAHRST